MNQLAGLRFEKVRFPFFANGAKAIIGGCCLYALICVSAYAHSEHKHTEVVTTDNDVTSVGVKIPNVEVRNQNNKKISFYDDLIRNKTVAINFIYTTCSTACPPQGATFSRLQKLISHRLGNDINLISISIDPKADTPARLKAWGKKFGVKPGWDLITGNKRMITQLLKSMDAYTTNKDDHSPIVLIGNDQMGSWQRVFGLASPKKIAQLLDQLVLSSKKVVMR